MKKHLILLLAGLVALTMATACKDETPAPEATQAPSAASGFSGKVVETMNAGSYTYVQVDTGKEKIWAAAPQFDVKVGDPVIVPAGAPMPGHKSQTLDRTFDLIYFVEGIASAGNETQNQQLPTGHPAINMEATPPTQTVDVSNVDKAAGGKTVAEVFEGKAGLAGKTVSVRGKVVKFNRQIMGKNWIHIQDGTGGAGTSDLTVTTAGTAAIGDTVLISGVVAVDKDFGAGYRYNVIVEEAQVTVEK